jgi:hypothetical protein
MVLSAINKKEIKVYNPFTFRALVSLNTIWEYVRDYMNFDSSISECKNLFDVNSTILEIARNVWLHLPIETQKAVNMYVFDGDSSDYNFSYHGDVKSADYYNFYKNTVTGIIENKEKIKKYVSRSSKFYAEN